MNKFKEIRPIVLGLATKENKLLVGEGYDPVRDLTFYRCLGGGIEFLEKSEDALKREFQEEIHANILIKEFLGVSENIFQLKGKDAHEIVLFYSIDIDPKDYKDEYIIKDTCGEFKAKWIDIDEFKNKNKTLFPVEVFKYL